MTYGLTNEKFACFVDKLNRYKVIIIKIQHKNKCRYCAFIQPSAFMIPQANIRIYYFEFTIQP